LTTPTTGGKADKPKSPGGKKAAKPAAANAAANAAAAAKKQATVGQLSAAESHIEKSTVVKTRDQIIDETRYIGMISNEQSTFILWILLNLIVEQ
jgi:hypothetical protein